jgi:phage gp46-like protein
MSYIRLKQYIGSTLYKKQAMNALHKIKAVHTVYKKQAMNALHKNKAVLTIHKKKIIYNQLHIFTFFLKLEGN